MSLYCIGLKLLGIYFAISGISMLPSFLIIYDNMEFYYSFTYSLLHPILMLFSGLFLFFKTEKIITYSKENDDKSSSSTLGIKNAVQLMGVYLVASSIGGVGSKIVITLFSEQPVTQAIMSNFIFFNSVFSVLIGLILIVKGKQLAVYIEEIT